MCVCVRIYSNISYFKNHINLLIFHYSTGKNKAENLLQEPMTAIQ